MVFVLADKVIARSSDKVPAINHFLALINYKGYGLMNVLNNELYKIRKLSGVTHIHCSVDFESVVVEMHLKASTEGLSPKRTLVVERAAFRAEQVEAAMVVKLSE